MSNRKGHLMGRRLFLADPSDITGSKQKKLKEVTANVDELNILDGCTATASELNALDGITSSVAELNILDGVTATAGELNYSDVSVNGALMTAGTGITGATGEVVKYGIEYHGSLVITRIMIDVTGLNSGGTARDIIGKDGGTANSNFGQITAAVNGTVWGGKMMCFETPAGGTKDIALYSATVATGAQDSGIAALTETLLCEFPAAAAGGEASLIAAPPANGYLYLATMSVTDADYTAGQFLITLYGYV